MMESVFLNGGDRLNEMKTELVYHCPPEDLGLKSCLPQTVEAEGENCRSWSSLPYRHTSEETVTWSSPMEGTCLFPQKWLREGLGA